MSEQRANEWSGPLTRRCVCGEDVPVYTHTEHWAKLDGSGGVVTTTGDVTPHKCEATA